MKKRFLSLSLAFLLALTPLFVFGGCMDRGFEDEETLIDTPTLEIPQVSTSEKEKKLSFRLCDSRDFDINGDGTEDECRIETAEIDGGFAMRFTAKGSSPEQVYTMPEEDPLMTTELRPVSRTIYYNVFRVPTDELRLVKKDGVLFLVFENEEGEESRYLIVPDYSDVVITTENRKDKLPYYGSQTIPVDFN